MGDPFVGYLKENPILVLVAAYLFWKFVKINMEVPEVKDSRVVKVRDMDEWVDILDVADKNDQLVVLLFFKNRNFACRKLIPQFGEMSKLYREVDVLFVKCNVDFNWEIKTSYKIDEEVVGLPYIKIFKGAEAIDAMQDWDAADLGKILEKNGVAASNPHPTESEAKPVPLVEKKNK